MFNLKIMAGINGIDPFNDNVDVFVTLENGDRYVATFYTLKNIKFLMDKWKKDGECHNGLYFWGTDVIIVETLSEKVIEDSISDLLKTGEFYTCLSKIEE